MLCRPLLILWTSFIVCENYFNNKTRLLSMTVSKAGLRLYSGLCTAPERSQAAASRAWRPLLVNPSIRITFTIVQE